jgi:hypothetical protein
MNDQDRPRFAQVLGSLGVVFGKQIHEEVYSLYFAALQDLTIDQIEQGAFSLIQRWKDPWLPTPATIREAAEGDIETRAVLALAELKQAMSHSGRYRSVRFQDAALMCYVEQCGGWPTVCEDYSHLSQRDLGFWEQNFKKTYSILARLGSQPAAKFLHGIADAHNSLHRGSFDHGALPPVEVTVYGQGPGPVRMLLHEKEETQSLDARNCEPADLERKKLSRPG